MAVDIDDIQVEPTISIDVSRMQAPARSCVAGIPIFRGIVKRSIAVVQEKPIGVEVIAGNQVQPTVVVEVGPQYGIGRSAVIHACWHSDFFEFHVAQVSEQAVRRKLGAYVDVLASVSIEIAYGHGVVESINVYTGGFRCICKQTLGVESRGLEEPCACQSGPQNGCLDRSEAMFLHYEFPKIACLRAP